MVFFGPPAAENANGTASWGPPVRAERPSQSSPPLPKEVAAEDDSSPTSSPSRRSSALHSPRPSLTTQGVDGLRRAAVMGATRFGAPTAPPPIAAYPDVSLCMDDIADDGSVEDLYEPSTVWKGDGVYDDKPAERKVSMDEVKEEKAAAEIDAKRQKELKKAIKDYMKTSLSRYAQGEPSCGRPTIVLCKPSSDPFRD